MGFRFSSFIAGAAENLTETLKEDEKQAAAAASFGVKALKENYDKVQAENRTLETELSKNVKFLRENDPTASEEQLFAAATNKTYMSAVLEAAKNNPGSFRVADVVKIKEGNESQGTALDMIKAYTTIPAISQAARQAEGGAVPEKPQGLFGIGTLRNRAAASAASRAEEQTAKAMGVSIEQLRASSGFKRPDIKTGAEFDYTSLQKPKSFTEQEDEAKSRLLNAQRANDPEKIKLAEVDLFIINNIKQKLTPAQTQFANKVADIKSRYMFGTPEEKKAAKPEYDRLMDDLRAEAMAKKTDKDPNKDIPALGTLNTFTSAAVARAVAAKHGDLIKSKQLALVEKVGADNQITVSIDYIGDDEAKRRQILETQATAAKNALSLYTDAQGKPFNRDVASVLNSFTSIVPSVVRNDTPAVDVAKERSLAAAAIAAQPNNADAIKANFKARTKQDY